MLLLTAPLQGRKYDGTVPHSKLIHMDADPVCYAVNKGNVHSQAIIVGDNNTLGMCLCILKAVWPKLIIRPRTSCGDQSGRL